MKGSPCQIGSRLEFFCRTHDIPTPHAPGMSKIWCVAPDWAAWIHTSDACSGYREDIVKKCLKHPELQGVITAMITARTPSLQIYDFVVRWQP